MRRKKLLPYAGISRQVKRSGLTFFNFSVPSQTHITYIQLKNQGKRVSLYPLNYTLVPYLKNSIVDMKLRVNRFLPRRYCSCFPGTFPPALAAAFTRSIMGRRNSSFIPGIPIISSGGSASCTASISKPLFSNPINI